MALTASTLIADVSTTLVDTGFVTWTSAELLGYLNEALRTTALLKPDLITVSGTLTLVAGVVQTLPAAGVALINITRNVGGRVVTQVDAQLLAEVDRFWPAATPQAQVEHFTVDPTTPRVFEVYPPNNGSGQVFAMYGVAPTALTSSSDVIPVADTYQYPLEQFMLSRAYAKNTKRQDLTKSAAAMQEWAKAVGGRAQAQLAISPKVVNQPGVA